MQIGETIYLDYQAATPVDARVLKVMHTASKTLFANPHAADHLLGWRAAAAILTAADQVANLFKIQRDDIIFTSGASEANAMAIRTAEAIATLRPQEEVLIGVADHSSIINEATQSRLRVRTVPLDRSGAPDLAHLKMMINEGTALVSVVGVNNENGAIADLKAMAAICKTKGVLFHADLAQAPLAMDIDLLDLGVDLATVSAHKLYGPKGVGALLACPDVFKTVKPVIIGAGQQGGHRGGTMPTELILGFGEACRLISEYGQHERQNVAAVRDRFVRSLEKGKIASLVGPLERRHPGNALLRFPGQDASELLGQLQPKIAASTQSACSSGSIEPSRVLLAMGYDSQAASECIRFSFGKYSTQQQADEAVDVIYQELSSQ